MNSNTLFILFLIAHYLGDFTHLSMPFMLKAKATGCPLLPIFAHASVHGVLMATISTIALGGIYGIVAFVTVTISHFLIDVAKGRLTNYIGPLVSSPTSVWYWYLFGFDQLLHILTLVFLIKLIVNG